MAHSKATFLPVCFARIAAAGLVVCCATLVACDDEPSNPRDSAVDAPTTLVDARAAAPVDGPTDVQRDRDAAVAILDGPRSSQTDGPDGGACSTTLAAAAATVDRCPDTFAAARVSADAGVDAGTVGRLPECRGYETLTTGQCGGLQVFGRGWGTHGVQCFYDPSTNALVGAIAYNDVPTYCNFSSHTIAGGSVRAGCVLDVVDRCGPPDAGR